MEIVIDVEAPIKNVQVSKLCICLSYMHNTITHKKELLVCNFTNTFSAESRLHRPSLSEII